MALGGAALVATMTVGGIVASASNATSSERCKPLTHFERDDFKESTEVDNNWLPLKPGTQFVLEGRANRGGGLLPHRVTFTVTDLVKVIDGVPSLVMYDVDTNEGQLVEAELAFFAQDEDDNVWTMGEYPEEFTDGEFSGAPSTWISGTAGAQAGVLVPGTPKPGGREYLQGYAPEIDFLDCARDESTSARACVPVGCFENALSTLERSPLDPQGGLQRKVYARGVGNVEIGAVDDPEGETLVLSEVRNLSADEMTEARQEALKLDARAYVVSEEVYKDTEPAEQLPDQGGDDDEDRCVPEAVAANPS